MCPACLLEITRKRLVEYLIFYNLNYQKKSIKYVHICIYSTEYMFHDMLMENINVLLGDGRTFAKAMNIKWK